MKRMSLSRRMRYIMMCLFFVTGGGVMTPVWSQNNQKVKITGTVYEYDAANKRVPLGFATVSIPDMALGTTSNDRGRYELDGVPTGQVHMNIQYLGKLPIDTLVNVTKDMTLNFILKNESFKLKEVTVTATNSRAGKSTASHISRQAMDHMQANSLSDLMSLLPGGTFQNQDLSSAQEINIRTVGNGDASSLNALGTAVIRDGAPISNNANMSAMNPTVAGSASSMVDGASPSGGVDVRSISTENIESVEIIRGIPSVEYGDLTSGAVIIKTKAGREPLRIKAKANPKVYQVSFGTGRDLGENKGAMNVSADYAYNINDPRASYEYYQRATAKLLYSNSFFGNKVRSNTSLDFIYGKDTRELNPDDIKTQTSSEGRDMGFTLNTNGTWNINKGWLKTVKYVLSGTYTDKQSFYETLYSTANAPYSKTYTDGAVLSNVAGQRVYDANGNEITNFTEKDAMNHSFYLPDSYLGHYNIDSREVNLYAKLTATLFKQSGNVNNRILIGADFKSDGNVGEGKTFDPTRAPYRNLSWDNASYRPRRYKDVPFINQFGAYIEDNFKWSLCGTNDLQIQAGLRYDHASVVGGVLSPRFNASLEFIPNTLTFFGGYGITAKMPTLLYLYPENAYFELQNINEYATTSDNPLLITTTRVFEIDNSKMKIARNQKAEIGFNLNMGKAKLNVTAFHERVKNGYTLSPTLNTIRSVQWDKYERDANGNLTLAGTYPYLLMYNEPNNNLNSETHGVEFDLNLGRVDAIRTSFQLTGAWMRTKTWYDGFDYYNTSGSDAKAGKAVAIYDESDTRRYRQEFTTTLRATHNIPNIGFVVTVSAQARWQRANWYTYGNDSIPVGYIDLDGTQNWFAKDQFATVADLRASEFAYMWQNASQAYAIKESWNPYFCFNLNVTKEISDMMRVSFFANNMFRSYPRQRSKRNPDSFEVLNNRFYFGLELSLTL